MVFKLIAKNGNAPVGALLLAELVREEKKINVEVTWSDDLKNSSNVQLLTKGGTLVGNSENEIARFFARSLHNDLYGGNNPLERTEVDSWLSFAIGHISISGVTDSTLDYLNSALALKTWLVAKRLTIADIRLFSALYNKQELFTSNATQFPYILRWFKQIQALPSFAKIAQFCVCENNKENVCANKDGPKSNKEKSKPKVEKKDGAKRKQEGKFIDLPGAEMGKVVVRFPPEASGYLHIGHAKAALLNQYYADNFKGKLIMRFDDTNPAKENVEFEKAILEDLEMLQIKPDLFTHSSDHFDLMLDYCEKLIKDGKAFVDNTPAEAMKEQRDQKLPSANRDKSVSENLALWEEMKKGTEKGQKCCVRAKIDYQSANGCMRDPTIYRCKPEPHPRTAMKYKVYPTYDFACPIVDAIEGVTHTLRTTEYHDRDPQFYWFIEALGLNRPYIWEYSRLNMTHTVLSKRKLTWFVSEGLVDSWDDPRFPTVRGILRRGMTVAGLKEFIIAQGSSKSVVFMEWDKIWAFNKKVIDPAAIRYTAISNNTVPVIIKNAKSEWLTVQNHPKDKSIGTKQVLVGPKVYIEREDADLLKENQTATFINWGNILIKKITKKDGNIVSVSTVTKLNDTNFKYTPKISWVCLPKDAGVQKNDRQLIPCYMVFFHHIMSKSVLGKDDDFKDFVAKNTRKEEMMLGECELSRVKKGEIIQILRKGFFRCDVPYSPISQFSSREQPLVLFHIPDGHSTSTTNNATEEKVKTKKENKLKSSNNSEPYKIHEKIVAQGDKIRELKQKKADKPTIDTEVKILLALKADFKSATGTDWTPSTVVKATTSAFSNNASQISNKITEQGNKVRELKQKKADKSAIDAEVKTLLALKVEYKTLTGSDWTPSTAAAAPLTKAPPTTATASQISDKITEQGNKVRELKQKKAEKFAIDAEVKILLALKAEYKSLTGTDWTPSSAKMAEKSQDLKADSEADKLNSKIVEQGDKVRILKQNKAEKSAVDAEVKILLNLKADYKKLTGNDWVNPAVPAKSSKNEKAKPAKKEKVERPQKEQVDTSKTGTRLGLEAKKSENLPDWYSQVITKGEMIEYYDVSGCYILRPWSFTIWEKIQNFFDTEIKKLGVQNCYFPIFVSRAALEKEKEHIADFAPEVAWVTKSGDSDLAEPIAIRPTSETVMYPAYAKWLKSHRDLPLKLNQWNNVVRWEFKHPQPFLRTREFLWQEGHTAFLNKSEANEEVLVILDLYRRIYEEFLAIPVIPGRKTEKEKFAGGEYTTTVEAFISASGRGIQGATSHHLGQNFSRMFDIQVEGAEEGSEKSYVYQNSWGLTTRTIGVMIMVHGDDKGLVIPPKVVSVQVIIVPCGITASTSKEQRHTLLEECKKLEKDLQQSGEIRVGGDYRDNYSPGWKFNHWELKGVPIRLELGPKDLAKNEITLVRRDTSERLTTARKDAKDSINKLLIDIQQSLFNKAKADLDGHNKTVTKWNDFCAQLDKKNLLLAPFCGDMSCEENIKKDSAREDPLDPTAPSMGAKSLCVPFNQPKEASHMSKFKCIHTECKRTPINFTLFGRSY